MATLDELLNSAASDGADDFVTVSGYEQNEYVDDYGPVIITNRKIGDMTEEISVRGDHRSQYVLFQTERYQDGIDLTKRTICIHWERDDVDGDGDNQMAVNVKANDTYIQFGWLIPKAATAYTGTLKVMPYAYLVEGDEMPYLLKDLYVEYTIHDGLDLSGGIAQPGTDWYEQFVIAIGQQVNIAKEQAAAVAKNVEAAKNSEANAKSYAEAAKTSETNAKTSETNATAAVKTSSENAALAKKYAESIEGDVELAEKAATSAENSANVAKEAAAEATKIADTIQIVSSGVYIASVTIKKNKWVASGDADYPYQNDVTIAGVDENFYSSTSIDKEDLEIASAANICSTTETLFDKVRFWAEKIPTADIGADIALLYANDSSEGALTTLPPATRTTLGLVMIGNNIDVDTSGLISVDSNDVVEETVTTDAETAEMLTEVFGF